MVEHRTRVGLHARNDVHFPAHDYDLVRRARIETLKMMSFTDVSVYKRLRQDNSEIEFIVRLYDDRIRRDSRPSPAAFVAKLLPIINRLKPYATKFEIHNEPNHVDGIEGWGASDDNARSFQAWYMQVLPALQQACPWAEFGFPGLALNHPHRDLAWLDICRDAIQTSDWLGCHCYWQYGNMLNDQWGLRFKLYHDRFPSKRIEITEFGNSTPNLPREQIAQQYVQYYQELNKYPYLGSASAFIGSSPDPAWVIFVWMKEGGAILPVVDVVGTMERKPAEVLPEPEPEEPPVPERLFPETGKAVRGNFLKFFDDYGLDVCGYPITEQFEEYGLQAQYFQRIALEELASGKIRLKLVGTETWTSRTRIADLHARIEELSQLPPGVGPTRPPIEDIVGELPIHATKRYPTRALADINQIVIHHTATSPTITAQRLAEYQVRKLDRPGIIYHFLVAVDGTIYQTNKLATVSDHAFSRNQESVGLCFPGNFTDAIPTTAQIEAGGLLCAWLLGSLRLPTSKIVGLREFVKTASPGREWLSGQRWKDKLLAKVEAVLEAVDQDQSSLIASLREQIEALEEEIEKLKQQPSPPTPEPEPRISRPSIQDLIDKLPKHKENTYRTRSLDDVQLLVIHHSAVPPTVGPERIAQYHVNKLDWPGIGYHFLVAEDGVIYQGNAVETVSTHAGKKGNPAGVGICFLGKFMQGVLPPPAQIQAGAHLVAWLMQELDLNLDVIKGHQELMQTACPGDQWLKRNKWKEMLRQKVIKVQQEETPLPEGKLLYHYVLFWAHDGKWAERDWLNAQGYIGAFRPAAGFSANEATQAAYVTIIGGPLGVSKKVEDQLKAADCRVDRIAGKDEADTRRMLDELVQQGKRFWSFAE
jgi:N-acetyl-anhydromuramyl-L-alanine amidase AmpD